MKAKPLIISAVVLACAASTAMGKQSNTNAPAGGGGSGGGGGDGGGDGSGGQQGVQQQDRDRLQTYSPDLDQKQTRLRECLPDEVQQLLFGPSHQELLSRQNKS